MRIIGTILFITLFSLLVYAAENDVRLTKEDASGNFVPMVVSDGTSGQALTTNGSGVWSFATISGGSSRTYAAMPITGNAWSPNYDYGAGTIPGAYTINAFSGWTAGDWTRAKFNVTGATRTITFTTAVYRIADGIATTVTSIDFDVDSHSINIFYDGTNYWVTDSGTANELDLESLTLTNLASGEFLVGDGVESGAYRTILDADIPDTITVSNYLPLAGGTMTGALTAGGHINLATYGLNSEGDTMFRFQTDSTPVNYFEFGNADTGVDPYILATGTDTNIGFRIRTTGTGNVTLGNFVFDGDQTVGAGQDNYVLTYDHTASPPTIGLEEPTETDVWIIACSDETTDLTTGTAKVTFRAPYAATVTGVRASLTTAATGANLLTVDINESATTILSTKITTDASETTSTTAATAPVISDSAIADDAEITIDIDQIGNTTAGQGLKVYIIHTH